MHCVAQVGLANPSELVLLPLPLSAQVLEPRRVAAKSAARRMAALLGEPVGRTVGYRVKLETRVRTSRAAAFSPLLEQARTMALQAPTCVWKWACNPCYAVHPATLPVLDHQAQYICVVALQVSSATRVEVVTEGILLRRLQQDPSLEVSRQWLTCGACYAAVRNYTVMCPAQGAVPVMLVRQCM